MSHLPYGYRIENGKPVIDDEKAVKLNALYSAYCAGMSFKDAGQIAGICKTHASIKRILQNRKYLGDDFYPRIVADDVFEKAVSEIGRRADIHNENREKRCASKPAVYTAFYLEEIKSKYDDPLQQAEYIYGLIRKEHDDGADA